jgi:GntR family transcriptional regulator / MocR family aminotransferase
MFEALVSGASSNGATNARQPASYFQLLYKTAGVPLHERLYQRVRELIVSGDLQHGARLPSSRNLASTLGMSRNSVLTAVGRLVADGLLETRKGSGIYVAYLGTHNARTEPPAGKLAINPILPFTLGVPPIDIFPAQLWQKLQYRRWQNIPDGALYEGDPLGWVGLREAIATHVAMTRAINCSWRQVVVTSSIAAGIDLAVRSLDLAGQAVWIEDPGYTGATRSLRYGGARLVPVPVDQHGLSVEAGQRLAPQAKAAFVTPACQFPTGFTMPPSRRRELLKWADETDAWILEDDFDWYNAADNLHLHPIAAKRGSRTIYVNSFNHILFTALRIAYLIIPTALIDQFAAVQFGMRGSSDIPNQMVLADFISGGHLDKHLRKVKMAHDERRKVLERSVSVHLSNFLEPTGGQGGSHINYTLKNCTTERFSAICRKANVIVERMSQFRLDAHAPGQILLGYAGFETHVIEQAVRQLGNALHDRRTA